MDWNVNVFFGWLSHCRSFHEISKQSGWPIKCTRLLNSFLSADTQDEWFTRVNVVRHQKRPSIVEKCYKGQRQAYGL